MDNAKRKDDLEYLKGTFESGKRLVTFLGCEKMGIVPEGFVKEKLPACVVRAVNSGAEKGFDDMERVSQVVWTLTTTFFKEMENYKYVGYSDKFVADFTCDWYDLFIEEGMKLLEKN